MISVSRRELKYLMNYEDSIRLQSELESLLKLDKHSQNGYYKVRSLYFDSWNNKDFVQKLDGVERRRKIRLRIYDVQQNNAKFEIKEKYGAYQKKDSLIVDRTDAQKYMKGEYGGLLDHDEETAMKLYSLLTLGAYRPAAIVEYERRAYTYSEFNTRITFDRNVRTSEAFFDLYSSDIPFVPVYMDQVILEVKYNGILLESVKSILGKYNLTNVSVSKYGMGRPLMEHYIV